MLAVSKPGDTYAGVAIVKEVTDPSSLAEMAWGLFERWQSVGFPAKEGWILDALGLVGDDETVRRITPLIRSWPADGGHARAVAALDVLSAIGSDVALMHLHGIVEKSKFKALKTKARQKMEDVSEGLGLSAEQLADRLVPDFGLDRDGSMLLDYGPRRFNVGFDEQTSSRSSRTRTAKGGRSSRSRRRRMTRRSHPPHTRLHGPEEGREDDRDRTRSVGSSVGWSPGAAGQRPSIALCSSSIPCSGTSRAGSCGRRSTATTTSTARSVSPRIERSRTPPTRH